MATFRVLGISAAVLSMLFLSASTLAQEKYPGNLFSVTMIHFDSVRAPHDINWYLRSREASAIIGSISTAMGIAPVYVKLAQTAIPPANPVGENTDYKVPVEPGYAYCATRLRVQSIVPAGGDQASLINVAVNPKELQMTTVTPVLHYGQGNSWAEGDIQVYGIKPEFLDEFINKGICVRVTTQVGILSCRGKDACGAGVTHGSPLDTGRFAPDLTTGF